VEVLPDPLGSASNSKILQNFQENVKTNLIFPQKFESLDLLDWNKRQLQIMISLLGIT
jgi:hypothetical protein